MRIAVASGKGGTGKTLVSTNLFWVVINENLPVTIIDCDAEEPNVATFIPGDVQQKMDVIQKIPSIETDKCTYCGKCHNYCTYKAIIFLPTFIKIVEELCHSCGACTYACEYEAIIEKDRKIGEVRSMQLNPITNFIEAKTEIGVYSPVPIIKKALQEETNNSLSILDSPPGISCPFIATVEKADFVIIVTEPTPFGLHDLKLTVETLKHLNKPFAVIINRAGLGNKEVYNWLNHNKIGILIEIPFDWEIAHAYSQGKLIVELNYNYKKLFLDLYKKISCILTE